MAAADDIVVLRNGRVVGATTPAQTSEVALAEMMVGREVDLSGDRIQSGVVAVGGRSQRPQRHRNPSLLGRSRWLMSPATTHVGSCSTSAACVPTTTAPSVPSTSCPLAVRAGEIVGVAGVEGNGQRELVEAITGLRHITGGSVTISGQDTSGARPRRVAVIGVGHIPEDRAKHGLIGSYSVSDNSVLNRYFRRPFSRSGNVAPRPY